MPDLSCWIPRAIDGSTSISIADHRTDATTTAVVAALASPLSTANVILSEDSSQSSSSSSSSPLTVIEALGVVLPIVFLIVCYPLFHKYLCNFSAITIWICNLLCPPRKPLYREPDRSRNHIVGSTTDSFYCVSAATLENSRRTMATQASHGTGTSTAMQETRATQGTSTHDADVESVLTVELQPTTIDHDSPPLQDSAGLPFPVWFDHRGAPQVEYIDIDNMTVKDLKALCKSFHLRLTGTKSVLLETLRAFSEDHNAWESLLPGVKRAHKGPHARGLLGKVKKSYPKKSAQRRAALLGDDKVSKTTVSMSYSPAIEHSKDTRTQVEIEAVIPWAQEIITHYPYKSHATDELAGSHAVPPPSDCMQSPVLEPSTLLQQQLVLSMEICDLVQAVVHQQNESAASCHPRCDAINDTTSDNAGTSSEGTTGTPTVAPAWHHDVLSQVAGLRVVTTDTSNPKIRTLKLGDRTLLTFTLADVPDPVAVSFANDIPRLNAMWDDDSQYWQGESVLKIKGHPIALAHWPKVYCYGKGRQWQGTKHNWGCWRDVVQRYRQGTPEDFWHEFSIEGKQMSFTAIVVHLRQARMRESKQVVMQVARMSQDGLTQFTYRKGNKTHVLTKPSAITRRFKALNGDLANVVHPDASHSD